MLSYGGNDLMSGLSCKKTRKLKKSKNNQNVGYQFAFMDGAPILPILTLKCAKTMKKELPVVP